MSDNIKQCLSPIISNKEILTGTYLMWLEASYIAVSARPGQFVMVSCENRLLRRPLSIHRIDRNGRIALLYDVIGKGTQWLSQQKKGEKLDVLGPLGNEFTLIPEANRLLLIAGRTGIAPLVFLADVAIEQNLSVTLLQGAANASQLYPATLLSEQIQYLACTEDGSQPEIKASAKRGMATDYIGQLASQFDQIFSCGPAAMYQSLKNQLAKIRYENSVQVSLDIRMGCGLGACYGCSIRTKQGMKKVCQDGPIFNLSDIFIEEIQT